MNDCFPFVNRQAANDFVNDLVLVIVGLVVLSLAINAFFVWLGRK